MAMNTGYPVRVTPGQPLPVPGGYGFFGAKILPGQRFDGVAIRRKRVVIEVNFVRKYLIYSGIKFGIIEPQSH
jgi:hypothetical protein